MDRKIKPHEISIVLLDQAPTDARHELDAEQVRERKHVRGLAVRVRVQPRGPQVRPMKRLNSAIWLSETWRYAIPPVLP